MKRCPVCNREYNNNEKICDDCGERLEECESEQITECVLVRSESQIQSRIYQQMLKDSNIPFYTTSGQFGGVSSLYMGYSVFGEDIIVSNDDYERAYELIYNEELPDAANDEVNDEKVDDIADKNEEEKPLPFSARRQVCRIVIWVIIIANAIALLWLMANGIASYYLKRFLL